VEKKRRQHYVWQHYLKAWTVEGQLWCQRGDKRFLADTTNVANRRDFYRLREMSDNDLTIVEQLVIQRTQPRLQELARGWKPHFTLLHEIKRRHEASGQRDEALERELDTAINNLEEDLHASIEGQATSILDALRRADTSVLAGREVFADFVTFIAAQYMRTLRIQRAVIGVLEELVRTRGFNAEASWGFMRTIYVTNMSAAFVARRQTLALTFLDSSAEAEFIAGDQPIINLRGTGADGAPPTEVELYYPLAPRLAILLDFDSAHARTERRLLTPREVGVYNRRLAAEAEEQIFSSSEVGLKYLLSE
jgi:hypothetical protein